MIISIDESKTRTNILHLTVDVYLMVENVMQIKTEIAINVSVSAKYQ